MSRPKGSKNKRPEELRQYATALHQKADKKEGLSSVNHNEKLILMKGEKIKVNITPDGHCDVKGENVEAVIGTQREILNYLSSRQTNVLPRNILPLLQQAPDESETG